MTSILAQRGERTAMTPSSISRRPFLSILLGLSVCTAPAVRAGDQPPQPLKDAGGHWTAWDPPTPPPDEQVYIVQPGDTLWSLATKFYGNPYLWPQLWERNQYVLDAHWIYPGDPLLVGTKVAQADDLETIDLGGGAPSGDETGAAQETGQGEAAAGDEDRLAGVLDADAAAGGPVSLGAESDLYCSGFIGDENYSFPQQIVGSEYEALTPALDGRTVQRAIRLEYGGGVPSERYGLVNGDIVYTSGGRSAGMTPGMLFTVVERKDRVRHPVTGEVYGRFYEFTGRLRILSVQDETAIAEIVTSCDDIISGSELLPFEPEPIPLARQTAMRPPNFPTAAARLEGAPVILRARDNVVSLGSDHVVFIDRGEADNIAPGDIFTIYRPQRTGLPPVVIGEAAILSVRGRSSVAKIIASRFPVYIGDRLEIK